jgi:hypothetical protein
MDTVQLPPHSVPLQNRIQQAATVVIDRIRG